MKQSKEEPRRTGPGRAHDSLLWLKLPPTVQSPEQDSEDRNKKKKPSVRRAFESTWRGQQKAGLIARAHNTHLLPGDPAAGNASQPSPSTPPPGPAANRRSDSYHPPAAAAVGAPRSRPSPHPGVPSPPAPVPPNDDNSIASLPLCRSLRPGVVPGLGPEANGLSLAHPRSEGRSDCRCCCC